MFKDVSHNNLKALPNGIGFMVRLIELNASHNNLKTLPDDLSMLRSNYCCTSFSFSL